MLDRKGAKFLESDIVFLIETVNPDLIAKLDTIKNDPELIEGMLDNEADRLFKRIMQTEEEGVIARISPQLLFEVVLRTAYRDMITQSYTVERIFTQKIPVFDMPAVVQFLKNKNIIRYLSDMLASFTRVESYSISIRVRKGIWRRTKFDDMDIDSLQRFCRSVHEEQRFAFYKRIADLCLFITGIFPEYATMGFGFASTDQMNSRLFGRLRRTAEEYEEEGRLFYRLAGKHKDADVTKLSEVFQQLCESFDLARKPLNYISEHYLYFYKQRLFPNISSTSS